METEKESKENIIVLLYYKYIEIDNPEQLAAEHLNWCKQNGIKGRILISKLGINGTCSGTRVQVEAYQEMMRSDPRFADIWFKEDQGDEKTFTKIFVRVKEELVTLRVPGVSAKNCGVRLEPEEVDRMIEADPENTVMVDMRNFYEFQLGRFKNAVPLEMDSFRELPQAVDKIEHLKDKKIIAYCTGGIRCETGTAYLKMRGFKNVYHINGGIYNYGKKCPDKLWEGEMFVFDRRVSVPINHENQTVVSQCLHCQTSCNVYINCINAACNALFICCQLCAEKFNNACSEGCSTNPRKLNYQDYMTLIQRRYASNHQLTKII